MDSANEWITEWSFVAEHLWVLIHLVIDYLLSVLGWRVAGG